MKILLSPITERTRLTACLCLWLSLLLWTPDADAHIVRPMNLDTLQQRANIIVQGQVVSQSSYWQDKVIYTVSQVQVQSCFKGRCQNKQIAIQQPGGTVNGLTMRVFGVQLLQRASRVVLFLYASHTQGAVKQQPQPLHRIVGLSQGILRFVRHNQQDWLVQDRSKLLLASSSPSGRLSIKHGQVHLFSAKAVLQKLKK